MNEQIKHAIAVLMAWLAVFLLMSAIQHLIVVWLGFDWLIEANPYAKLVLGLALIAGALMMGLSHTTLWSMIRKR